MIVLALEVSTTSLKSMLYHSDRGILRTKSQSYEHLGTYGEVNADTVFHQLMALGKDTIGGEAVDCVALSCTWHSLLFLDRELNCTSPLFLWCNTMAGELVRRLREDEEASYARYNLTGALVNSCYPYYKLRYLKEKGFDLSDRIIGGNGAYFNYLMADEFAESLNMISGSGLFDLRKREYAEELLRELGITKEQLPPVLPPETVLRINKKTAEELGCAEGTMYIPAMSDGALDQIGAHAMRHGSMTFSVGTSGSMRFRADGPMISEKLDTWCYLAPDGNWLSGIGTTGCCNCVDFYRNLFLNGMSFDRIEPHLSTFMEDAPIFLPFQYGERGPGWNDAHTGSFHEIRGNITPYHFYYAVLEGTMFNMRQCYDRLTAMNGEPKRIRISGGILNSTAWLQMCLDMFGLPMEEVTEKQSSVFGAVLLSMLTLKEIDSYKDTEKYSPEGKILLPGDTSGKYEERYRRYCSYYDKNV